VGTTIEVRDLFFNTPVRHKFLRSAQTESGHSVEALTRLALAHPQTHFTLAHNGRPMHDLPPVADIRARVTALFGDELADGLIEIRSHADGVTLSGYVGNPMHYRSHSRMQYLFLNGRAIRDRALQHALGEAYRGLLLTGRQPICFLRLDMPAEMVDVNVHPTKQEVRFQDAGRLYSQLLGTLRTKFLTTDLTARGAAASARQFAAGGEADVATEGRSQLVDWAKQQLREEGTSDAAFPRPKIEAGETKAASGPLRADRPPGEPLQLHRFDVPAFRPFDASASRAVHDLASRGGLEPAEGDQDRKLPGPAFGAARGALQVHNRYLVVETDSGIEVIDQHALHERILYEQLRGRVLGGALESQKLLVPEPVDLSAAEAAAVLEQSVLLARLGVEVQPFGGDTVLVASYPAMLANMSPSEVLRELVEKLLVGGRAPEARDLLDELLHMIACKAAVKFGDRLSAAEIDALLAERHLAEDSHHCPHGRPTSLVFTREDLDRQFQRI
jgi:DNA mismatch repair protein MutL